MYPLLIRGVREAVHCDIPMRQARLPCEYSTIEALRRCVKQLDAQQAVAAAGGAPLFLVSNSDALAPSSKARSP